MTRRLFLNTVKSKVIGLLLIILTMYGCEKINETDKGNISFGVNTHIINCIATGEVFIDSKSIGIIPGFCDSIVDCESGSNLNKEISVGKHSYKIEVKGQSGTCYKVKEGDFELGKGECIKIFLDLRE
jgi:hypothetical protein